MEEFINKLIEQLEKRKKEHENDYREYALDDDFGAINAYGHAIEIVNQLAEEYS